MNNFPHAELTYYLRGIGFRIHNALKGGHEEKVYEEALILVLDKEDIAYHGQPQFTICYKGKQIGEYYPDLTFENHLVLGELKAAPKIENQHKAQVLSYMAVTNAELGFIMNFGASSLQTERLPNFLRDRPSVQWQPKTPENILYPELTNRVLESCHIVHHELGPGFLSQIYRRAVR
ncbi:MAG: GxxExxY protein [Caldilineaceae bacterium]